MRERDPIVIPDVPLQIGYPRSPRLQGLARRLSRVIASFARRVVMALEPSVALEPLTLGSVRDATCESSGHAMVRRAARSCTPPRVLLVAADRRFRELACTLLTQRGCWVTVHERNLDVREQAARDGADVVVLDATGSLTAAAEIAARLHKLRPQVGLVPVSSDPRDRLVALPVVSKWGSADLLYLAIEQARQERGHA